MVTRTGRVLVMDYWLARSAAEGVSDCTAVSVAVPGVKSAKTRHSWSTAEREPSPKPWVGGGR
jgi:hypothetical protein